MKKFVFAKLVVILLIVMPTIVEAEDAVKERGKNKFFIGVERNSMERDTKSNSYFGIAEFTQLFVKGGYKITDKFNVCINIGKADYLSKTTVPNPYGMWTEEDTCDFGFALGIGIEQILYNSNGWRLNGNIQYNTWESDVTSSKIRTPDKVISINEVSGEAEIKEWYLALSVSKEMGFHSLYGGVKYSKLKADASISGTLDNKKVTATGTDKSEDDFGIFVGVGIIPLKSWDIYIEGRIIDEDGVSVGTKYKF